MTQNEPATYGAATDREPEMHALATAPVGFGAQRVVDSQVPFPDGRSTGWVFTIGGAVAYVSEATMVTLAHAVLESRAPR